MLISQRDTIFAILNWFRQVWKKNFYSENIFHFAHKLSYFSYDVVTFLQHKAPQKWPRQTTVQTPLIKFICHPDSLENKFTHFDPKHARMQDSSMQQGYLCILWGGEKKYVIKIICENENIWKRTILPFFKRRGLRWKLTGISPSQRTLAPPMVCCLLSSPKIYIKSLYYCTIAYVIVYFYFFTVFVFISNAVSFATDPPFGFSNTSTYT